MGDQEEEGIFGETVLGGHPSGQTYRRTGITGEPQELHLPHPRSRGYGYFFEGVPKLWHNGA